MKQKNMSRLLQALLLIAGLLGAVFFFAFLPFYGRELVQCAPEYAALFWPCLVWAWAFAVPVFWALFPCWQVFGSIARKGAAFTRENAARLRLIRLHLAQTHAETRAGRKCRWQGKLPETKSLTFTSLHARVCV